MSKQALVLVYALILWQSPIIEVADRGNNKIISFLAFATCRQVLDVDLPFTSLRSPVTACHLLVEASLVVYVVLFGQPGPVSLDFLTLGKRFAPLGVRIETRLVDMRGDIASYTRIDILEPGPTLLYDQKRLDEGTNS